MIFSNHPLDLSSDDLKGQMNKNEDASRPPKVRKVQVDSTKRPSVWKDEDFVPTDELDPDKIDSMIAQEMTSLSIEDREKLLYEIHGISHDIEETSDLLQSCLRQLDVELLKLQNAPAFQRAKKMNPKFIEDETFRLKFLRADLFDPYKAAERMAIHFQLKLELFGPDLLTRNITQDDLDHDTMNLVYSGRTQRLKDRDRAGRSVGIRFQHPTTVPIIAQLRATFYLGMIASEEDETQRKGQVVVSYLVGEPPDLWNSFHYRREINQKLPITLEALPIRHVGIHVCHDFALAWRLVLAVFKVAAKQWNRIRIREHYGDKEECLLSLRSFGIPTEDFPVDPEGNMIVVHHRQTMEEWRKKERQRFLQNQVTSSHTTIITESRRRVVSPADYDILLGRGKSSYQHAGNVTLRRLVEDRWPAYEVASQIEKAKMSADIVALIRQSNGCFLEHDGIGWVEVSETAARRKVAHAFRTLRHQGRLFNESESS